MKIKTVRPTWPPVSVEGGVSSGIHPYHSDIYIRKLQVPVTTQRNRETTKEVKLRYNPLASSWSGPCGPIPGWNYEK